MWNGEVIHKGGSQLPGARSKIPDYYQDMDQWLRNDSSKTRIISLPFNYGGNAMYLWPGNYGFVGGDFIIYFSGGKSVIYNYIDETMDPLIDFHKDVEKYSCNKTHLKLLGMYNVKYILFHGDSNWEGIKRVSMFSNRK